LESKRGGETDNLQLDVKRSEVNIRKTKMRDQVAKPWGRRKKRKVGGVMAGRSA